MNIPDPRKSDVGKKLHEKGGGFKTSESLNLPFWGNVYVYKAARPDGMPRQVPESIDVFAAELLASEKRQRTNFSGAYVFT